MNSKQISISCDRLLARLDGLNAINRLADGSCCRLALTDADRRARDLVVSWMKALGLDVRIDRIGNIIGIRRGANADAPLVMTGSHVDTVATGGRYDGTLGVLAGLEAVASLNEAGVETERGLAVAVFTNEEGVRFQPDMMGSLVYAGGLPLEDALRATAADGAVLGDELARIGYAGSAECGELRLHAYVELHVEQGPILDREGGVLGAVENLLGISWQEVVIRGTSNHAGTTPMGLRHDAAYCAARIAVFVRQLARRMGGSQVGTVGSIRLVPNLVNVIAGEASLTVDLRNTDERLLQSAESKLARFLRRLAQAEGVAIDVRRLARTEPVCFDRRIAGVIEDVARELGKPIRSMTSGAGHDAQMLARLCPAAMIFVPSVGGISHNPAELTCPDHLETGANALLRTLERLANE